MPHQCLGCGRAFAQGSMDMLKGCPGCKGTRFFFTEKVLDDAARQAKAQRSSGDLREVLEAMAREDKLDAKNLLSGKSFDDWVQLAKPESGAPGTPPPAPTPAASPVGQNAVAAPSAAPVDEATATQAAPRSDEDAPIGEQLDAQLQTPPAPRSVGTVQVHEPGNYTLDVEQLLAAKPIVIEKEGVYMIHLASAFEAPREGALPIRRKR